MDIIKNSKTSEVEKITDDDEVYKFEELVESHHYIHFKLQGTSIECSILYLDNSLETLESLLITPIYSISLGSSKKWDSFIKYINNHTDHYKFWYGYLLPDKTELMLTFPYKTNIGCRMALTHVVGDYTKKESLDVTVQ